MISWKFKHDEPFISIIFPNHKYHIIEISLRGIHIWDLSDLKAVSLSSPNPSLSLPLSSVQFLSTWVLVCSELQSGPRSFIQNQMRVWQPLHLRHFRARQLRLGKSSVCSQYMLMFSVFFHRNYTSEMFLCSVGECGAVWAYTTASLLVVFERFAVALPSSTSLSPCRWYWSEKYVMQEIAFRIKNGNIMDCILAPRFVLGFVFFCTSLLI